MATPLISPELQAQWLVIYERITEAQMRVYRKQKRFTGDSDHDIKSKVAIAKWMKGER